MALYFLRHTIIDKYKSKNEVFKINSDQGLVNLGAVQYAIMDKTGVMTSNKLQLENVYCSSRVYNMALHEAVTSVLIDPRDPQQTNFINESLQSYNQEEEPMPSIHSQLSFNDYEETDFNTTSIQENGKVSEVKRGMMKRSMLINSSSDKFNPFGSINNLSSVVDSIKQGPPNENANSQMKVSTEAQ